MLFSELHASILNGKKEKKINVAVVEKQILTKRFHKALRAVILVFSNNEISIPLSFFLLQKLPIVREHQNGFHPP